MWGQSAWPSYPNNNAISVTSGGNIGIGTTSPSTLLHLYNSGGLALHTLETNTSFAGLRLTSNARSYQVSTAANDIGAPYAGSWYVHDENAGATRLLITSTGNVGIGTTTPQHKLSVNGTIQAKEVMVNTGWADYVFRPGYRLRPLSEVSAYIKAHHHLPEIPSEAEVKAQGVSVGEMQSKLLAKIEELTLHMIHADERNNRLEEQNQEFQERIARLESRTR